MATVTDPLFAFLLWFISRGTDASAGVRHTAVAGAGGAHRGGGRGRRTARSGAGVVIVCLLFSLLITIAGSLQAYCQ